MPVHDRRYFPDPVRSDLFNDAPDEAAFRVVVTRAQGGYVPLPFEEELAKEILKHTYVEAGIIPEGESPTDPTLNFERHLVVERGSSKGVVLPFATSCIIGGSSVRSLPVADLNPSWLDDPAEEIFGSGAIESARLTSRHPVRHVQRLGFMALIRSTLGYAMDSNTPRIAFQTEAPHVHTLERLGLPLKKGATVSVQEARQEPTELIPVVVDYLEVKQSMQENPSLPLSRFLSDLPYHLGLDWFDKDMMPVVS